MWKESVYTFFKGTIEPRMRSRPSVRIFGHRFTPYRCRPIDVPAMGKIGTASLPRCLRLVLPISGGIRYDSPFSRFSQYMILLQFGQSINSSDLCNWLYICGGIFIWHPPHTSFQTGITARPLRFCLMSS